MLYAVSVAGGVLIDPTLNKHEYKTKFKISEQGFISYVLILSFYLLVHQHLGFFIQKCYPDQKHQLLLLVLCNLYVVFQPLSVYIYMYTVYNRVYNSVKQAL